MPKQITFIADENLKNEAMKKAKSKGITLKAVLVLSLQAFVDGKIDLGISTTMDPEVEEMHFDSSSIAEKSDKLANLLK
jgi:purine-nucleoside phosphorylase